MHIAVYFPSNLENFPVPISISSIPSFFRVFELRCLAGNRICFCFLMASTEIYVGSCNPILRVVGFRMISCVLHNPTWSRSLPPGFHACETWALKVACALLKELNLLHLTWCQTGFSCFICMAKGGLIEGIDGCGGAVYNTYV